MIAQGKADETWTVRGVLRAVVWSRWLFWAVLASPAIPIIIDLWWLKLYYPETMYTTGLLSAQLLVATLAITPVSLLLRHWEWGLDIGRWLRPRRRYLGLAAAGYAALHTAHYIRYENDLEHILLEVLDTPYLVGWLAIFVFIPLAMTSNTRSVHALGLRWKPLQRFVYLATAGAFLHWILLDQRQDELYLWSALLVFAKLVHIVLRWQSLSQWLQNALRSRRSPSSPAP